MTTSIRLKPETEARLTELARRTGRTKTYYISELIEEGLPRLEWENHILNVSADVRSGREKTYSLEEVEKDLGL